ncbi:MAG TPA: DUF5655 domain-containing protein [Terriglobales bacterium]|jgi:hypothetical protein
MSPSREVPAKKSLYSVHPGIAMVQKWVAELPSKTGRSLEEWVALVKASGPVSEAERREWLKKDYGLGPNGSSWIAERSVGKGEEDADPQLYLRAAEGYVEAMFAGKRSGLRPLYDKLLHIGLRIGKDVKACPGKTIVPLYRKHVFAQIKPSTNSRIDLGLALGATKTPKRLVDTGGLAKRDRITHRIEIMRMADIDDDVRRWLAKAYELDA